MPRPAARICVPIGQLGGQEIFGAFCERLGLEYYEYDVSSLIADLASIVNVPVLLLILPTSIPIEESLISQLTKKVKYVGTVSTGVDHVDFASLHAANIGFVHAPGINADSVAQYVISSVPLLEMQKPMFGIIGFGNVGRRLAKYLDAIQLNYCFYDPFVPGGVDLRDALSSDVISFHVPLTSTGDHPTFHMVHGKLINEIPESSWVINTSRGGIMSESDFSLLTSRNRTIMDVFPIEPPGSLALPPTYSTPHVAGYNYEARVGGCRAALLSLCNAEGLDSSLIPDLPFVHSDYHILDAIRLENTSLKRDVTSFKERRLNYPPRLGFTQIPESKWNVETQLDGLKEFIRNEKGV